MSFILPESILNTSCNVDCVEGSYLDINSGFTAIECKKCAKNSYSLGGKFKIDGFYKEWSIDNEFFQKIEKRCYVEALDEIKYNVDCTGFTSADSNSYIVSGSTDKMQLTYYADLRLTLRLAKPGKLTFRYQKDRVKKNGMENGEMQFYINYFQKFSDKTANKKFQTVSYDLDSGFYTFYWIYAKYMEDETSKDLSMKLDFIEIEGYSYAETKCSICEDSYSEEGSGKCLECKDDFYFDNITVKL